MSGHLRLDGPLANGSWLMRYSPDNPIEDCFNQVKDMLVD